MNNALLRLLHISDPSLPVGAYAHSGGLETYVQCGVIHDSATAQSFVTAVLTTSLQYTDAAFLSLAYDAAGEGDEKTLILLDAACSAVKLPEEIRKASSKLG